MVHVVNAGGEETSDYLALREHARGPELRNSVADQPYGPDPRTGAVWGYQGRSEPAGSETDSMDRSLRYATDHDDLVYRFAGLARGSYSVHVGYYDPWPWADRAAEVSVNGTVVEAEQLFTGTPQAAAYEGIAVGEDGEIVLSLHPTRSPDIQLSWIVGVEGWSRAGGAAGSAASRREPAVRDRPARARLLPAGRRRGGQRARRAGQSHPLEERLEGEDGHAEAHAFAVRLGELDAHRAGRARQALLRDPLAHPVVQFGAGVVRDPAEHGDVLGVEEVDEVADPRGEVVAGAQQGLLRRGVTGGLGPHQPFDEVPVMGDGQQLVLR